MKARRLIWPMRNSWWPVRSASRAGTSWRNISTNSVRAPAFIGAARIRLNTTIRRLEAIPYKGENPMKLKSLLLACFVILSAVSIFAQSGGTAVDPISGIWTGDLGPNADPRFPVRLELKFDGQSAISGTITGPPLPGEIKGGTFDPKTGALKLEVEVKGDGVIRQFVLEGTVVSGVATGSVSSSNQSGNFKITKGAGDSVSAQQSGANDAAAALRYGFGEVSGWVTKAADLVPADKYDYRPSPSVRTFGQLIAHIADAQNYY